MYDLIVIGDDLSSHIAAAYAAHQGLKPLLIAESGLGGITLIDDIVFNVDFSPITGLAPCQLGRGVLDEMGIVLPDEQTAPVNPAYQVILPEHRLDFSNDLNSLKAEMAREFPEEASDIGDFYDLAFDTTAVLQDWASRYPHVQPANPKEFLSYLKIFPHVLRYKFGAVRFDKLLSQNPALEKVWEAQQALLSLNIDDPFSFASPLQYCAPLRGVARFTEGKQFLFNALIGKVEAAGGLYLSGYQIDSVARDGAIGLEIRSKNDESSRVSAPNLIVSTKAQALSLIQDDKKRCNWSDRFRPATPALLPVTLFMGVRYRCLPEPIASHVAVVTRVDRDLYDDNLIVLDIHPPTDEIKGADPIASLTASCFMPHGEDAQNRDGIQKKFEFMLSALEEFLPFLREGIVSINMEQSMDTTLMSRKVVSPKYRIANSWFSSFAAKSHKTRLPNVFITGSSLIADAGFDAEMLSGKHAALLVTKKGSS